MATVKIELEVTDGEVTNVCIDGERTVPTANLVIEAAHEFKYVTTILSYTTSSAAESSGEETECADEDVGSSGEQVYAARMPRLDNAVIWCGRAGAGWRNVRRVKAAERSLTFGIRIAKCVRSVAPVREESRRVSA